MSGERDLQEALDQIEKVREQRQGTFYLEEDHITLSHGSGGKASHNLIEGVFGEAFSNPILDQMGDSAVFSLDGAAPADGEAGAADRRIAFTTDSFVVSPLFFPGGDIGELAVNGTVNDLAVSGAVPLHLSVSVILEEGFPIADLKRVVASMEEAADAAGVQVVTGDTKVVEKGKADGLYVNTAGVGRVREDATGLSASAARPGDAVLVSGPVGEHGTAIMMEREELALSSDLESDTAPMHGLAGALLDAVGGDARCLRDATRGGVASVLNEIAVASGVGIGIRERDVPVPRPVRGACEILGIDPLHMANEGKLIAVVAPDRAGAALEALRSHPLGQGAAAVGSVEEGPEDMVWVETGIGGRRVLDMLVGDALPRIC